MSEKKEPSFEQALARLEEIVRALEGGNVPLEDLIKLYDEGTALVKQCTEKLNAAEEKVRLLQLKDGALTEGDFENK
ncbi:MAG: exodeoxyribonuclease VII small subunit [Clostridia bacterium]|nr:exodeoxyribonuclease VII small subunit [Clostridia bacterium]MBR5745876.1 exodeoxyribonuclease VII small subunit [Clostridia bacterium]